MRLTPACSPLPSGGWALRARRGVTGGRAVRDKLRVGGRAGEMDGGWRAGLRCFWSFAGSVGLCISLVLVPASFFLLLSPSPLLTLFLGFALLCVAPCAPDLLAVPFYLSPFHHGPPVNPRDAALPSEVAIEARVLHTGWNRPR